MIYSDWFKKGADGQVPHAWQRQLAENTACGNRLIRIPTGMGKTLGVLGSWLYNRVERADNAWPRRLIWCLPMRTLVEQTAEVIRSAVEPYGISVHVLMGGVEQNAWHLHPEQNAVLVGTQDMLLSRAMNRGYGVPRARWPMEFGLLNSDCLWVLDEVQLMDVGLATTAQLQQFREEDQLHMPRPSFSWWMSATLQPDWLKSVDTHPLIDSLEGGKLTIPANARKGRLWEEVKKPLVIKKTMDEKELAEFIAERHAANSLTLVIVNTVKRASAVFGALAKNKTFAGKIELVHSRFRPYERKQWRERFLNRASCENCDRIVIATQVVEAGVDISASCLITDLAPWPSLVQRFGRAARYGGHANVFVVDVDTADEKKAGRNAAPYSVLELVAARDALSSLTDVSPRSLESFEDGISAEICARLYPYDPMHLLLRRELDELFDTTPDLSGADIDVSRFIRSGEERDVQVFWRVIPGKSPEMNVEPSPDELCPVPFLDARSWLKDHKGNAWVWDYLDEAWRPCMANAIYTGQTLLVRDSFGGYSAQAGWTGNVRNAPVVLSAPTPPGDVLTDRADAQEALAMCQWKTIHTHGMEVGNVVDDLARKIGLSVADAGALARAGRWHDVGKAHPAFQNSIRTNVPDRPQGAFLAKAPQEAWRAHNELYRISDSDQRPGFRHELASALALFAILERYQPLHPALLGPHREIFELLGHALPQPFSDAVATSASAEVLSLSEKEFNLLVYLVCSHHGKVRAALHISPKDQAYEDRDGRGLPMRGVREGDTLPAFTFVDQASACSELPELRLTQSPAGIGLSPRTGASWTERVLSLRAERGPFELAFLEAILRAADIRASQADTSDPLLNFNPRK
jgi:CRISPR-associated endonuclease/helicase Cas3